MIQRRYRQSVLARLHLARVHTSVVHTEQSVLAEFDLTPAQFDVLSRLATEPGVSQQTLADHLLVTKGNVCGLIDRLEQAGFVERCVDQNDRRTNHLHLTQKGEQTFEEAAPALEAALDDLFSALSQDEKSQLMSLLARLDRALNR